MACARHQEEPADEVGGAHALGALDNLDPSRLLGLAVRILQGRGAGGGGGGGIKRVAEVAAVEVCEVPWQLVPGVGGPGGRRGTREGGARLAVGADGHVVAVHAKVAVDRVEEGEGRLVRRVKDELLHPLDCRDQAHPLRVVHDRRPLVLEDLGVAVHAHDQHATHLVGDQPRLAHRVHVARVHHVKAAVHIHTWHAARRAKRHELPRRPQLSKLLLHLGQPAPRPPLGLRARQRALDPQSLARRELPLLIRRPQLGLLVCERCRDLIALRAESEDVRLERGKLLLRGHGAAPRPNICG